MAKWFKFEEKKPRVGRTIIVWHYIKGRYFARLTGRGALDFDYIPVPSPDFFEDLEYWQYAPKGPKEER